MKNRILIILYIFGLLLAGCGRSSTDLDAVREVKVGVVEVGQPGDNAQSEPGCEYVGSVEESSSVTLCFTTSGRVKAVYVKEGQTVRTGQLLAEIDNSAVLNSYKAAQATLRQAQDGYDRAKMVYDKGSLPEVKWVEVKTQLDQAQSLADIAKKNLDDCKLYAPCGGTVADRSLEVGATATPYQPVMRLLNLGPLVVKVSIPESDISQVKTGTKARVVVPALDNMELQGMVDERNVSADPLSHSYTVHIRLQGSSGKNLLPGMVCKVTMGKHSSTGGLILPNRAVQVDNDGQRFVWKVVDGKARRQSVSIGDLSSEGVLITSGLDGGEQVIVDGAIKVSEGTKVKAVVQ